MTTRIIGTGSCLPEAVVTNDDLGKIMDTSDEWIRSRTGIRERHLAVTETTTSMSVQASQRALQDAGVRPEELDLIIAATITGDCVTPSTACEIQAALGAAGAAAFDINGACSGFLFALHTAHAYLRSGLARTALIVGAETLSRIMDWNDRSTCVLFGDGAGAAVVRAEEEGLLGFDQGADGVRGNALICGNRRNDNPLVKGDKTPDYVSMDGQEVYKFAVSEVPASVRRALDVSGVGIGEIKYFILHQANKRILDSVARRLGVEEERFPTSLEHCGNISSASVPILLDEVNRRGQLSRGDKIVLSGFGAGLTWGTSVLTW